MHFWINYYLSSVSAILSYAQGPLGSAFSSKGTDTFASNTCCRLMDLSTNLIRPLGTEHLARWRSHVTHSPCQLCTFNERFGKRGQCAWHNKAPTHAAQVPSQVAYQEVMTTYGVQHQMKPTTMVMVSLKVRCRALWIWDRALHRNITVPLFDISLSTESPSLCWRLDLLEISQTIAE